MDNLNVENSPSTSGDIDINLSDNIDKSDEVIMPSSKSFDKLKKRNHFNLFDTALACMVFIVLNFVFILALRAVPANLRTQNSPVILIASFLVEALFGLAAWIVAKANNVNIIKAAGMNRKISDKMIWLGLLIAVGSLCLFGALTFVYSDFLILIGYKPKDYSIKIDTFGMYLIYVVISCLAPAFFEDLLFRGVILSGLNKKGKETSAIVFSSIIFMLMHGNAEQTVHQLVVGMVLAYLFIKSKNLWLGVIVHFFNNFVSVTISYIMSFVDVSETVTETTTTIAVDASINPWFAWVVELIIALMIASAGYFIIMKLAKKMIAESDRVNSDTIKMEVNETLSTETTKDIVSEYLKELTGETYSTENSLTDEKTDDEKTENSLTDKKILDEKTENIEQASTANITINEETTASVKIVSSEDSLSNEVTVSSEINDDENIKSSDSANELLSENQEEKMSEGKSMATALLLIFSNAYLVFEWILSLISGF